MNTETCLVYPQNGHSNPGKYGRAPAYEGTGTEEMIRSLEAYGSYYVLEHGAKEKDYTDYCEKLERCGFTRYSSTVSNGNRFATYTDGENVVNVSYVRYHDTDRYVTADVSYVAIAVDLEKNSALPPKGEPYRTVTTGQVTYIWGGFIIRLPDGRFLNLDIYTANEEQTDLLYRTLCEMNVLEGKPVIAAWMFSHAHGDHVNAILGLLKKYSGQVEIQRIIHGFPGEETYVGKNYMEYTMDNESRWMTFRSNEIKRLMDENMPEGKFTVAHTGQVFEYPGAKIEVLFTSENLYRQQMFDTNMSSVVYRYTLQGGTLLALGDAVDGEAKILRKIHGKALKSDAVVLAHHAFNGGDEELYHDIGAVAAIWPNTLEYLIERHCIGDYVNHFDPTIVKHNLIISQDRTTMTLYPDMPAEEFDVFDRKLDVKPSPAVDYDSRRNPKNELTEVDLAKGYGNAPRYYGAGEETETLVKNEDEKTYQITVRGTTDYSYDFYRNTLKRDGFWPMSKTEEAGRKSAVYASPLNEAVVSYSDGVLTVHVGPAGVNALHRDHE